MITDYRGKKEETIDCTQLTKAAPSWAITAIIYYQLPPQLCPKRVFGIRQPTVRASNRGGDSTNLCCGRLITRTNRMGPRRKRSNPLTVIIIAAAAIIPGSQYGGLVRAQEGEKCWFCQDGNMELEDPNRLVYGRTCDRWQKIALGTTDTPLTPCGEYEYVGWLCGCDNRPPEWGCKLCPSGSTTIKYPDRPAPEVTLSGIPGVATNCEEMRLLVQYAFPQDGLICPVQQSVIASYCGCPDANPMVCPLCKERMTIEVGGVAPPFEVETKAGYSLPFMDFSCLDSEYIANAEYLVDETGCDMVRAQVSGKCCVSADSAESQSLQSQSSASRISSLRILLAIGGAVLFSYLDM